MFLENLYIVHNVNYVYIKCECCRIFQSQWCHVRRKRTEQYNNDLLPISLLYLSDLKCMVCRLWERVREKDNMCGSTDMESDELSIMNITFFNQFVFSVEVSLSHTHTHTSMHTRGHTHTHTTYHPPRTHTRYCIFVYWQLVRWMPPLQHQTSLRTGLIIAKIFWTLCPTNWQHLAPLIHSILVVNNCFLCPLTCTRSPQGNQILS